MLDSAVIAGSSHSQASVFPSRNTSRDLLRTCSSHQDVCAKRRHVTGKVQAGGKKGITCYNFLTSSLHPYCLDYASSFKRVWAPWKFNSSVSFPDRQISKKNNSPYILSSLSIDACPMLGCLPQHPDSRGCQSLDSNSSINTCTNAPRNSKKELNLLPQKPHVPSFWPHSFWWHNTVASDSMMFTAIYRSLHLFLTKNQVEVT